MSNTDEPIPDTQPRPRVAAPSILPTPKPINRSGWPRGPWDDEGDFAEWVTAAGLRAAWCRCFDGHLCGYVEVPAEHPLHGIEYMTETPVLVKAMARREFVSVEEGAGLVLAAMAGRLAARPDHALVVHGGVTYSGRLKGAPSWWFGFDCSHAWDVRPADPAEHDSTYRSAPFVVGQCEKLAAQLVAVEEDVRS